MEQTITIKPRWEGDEQKLMERLHQALCGVDLDALLVLGAERRGLEGPYRQESGRWQLDSSNDWWAALLPIDPETKALKLKLTHRYDTSKFDAFVHWCRFALN